MVLLWNSAKLVRQKRDLEKSYKDIERMSEIGQAITSSLSVKDIIDKVYENVNELMDATVFTIAVYNPEKQRLDLPGSKEYGRELPFKYYELSDENRLAVHCFKNEVDIRFGDYKKEYSKYIKEIKPPLRGDTFNSIIYLPLLIKNEKIEHGKKKIGAISVQSKKINAYSDYHYNILKNLAIYVAIALDNAYAYKKIEEQKTLLEHQASEKMQLEKKVQIEKEINHHKDELMYTVSHQYKTPLTIIQGSAQMFRDYLHKMTETDVKKHLSKIFTNLDYMKHLIETLLNFGKKFNPGYYNLRDFCKNFVDSIKDGKDSSINIEFKAVGDCTGIKIDKDFMGIILNNLVMNSINYSAQGSKIIVDLCCDTNNAVIKVIDNGIGIPEDYLQMPFERFHRGSNVGSIRGTGLGLVLVKRYVDLHNGNIQIESQLGKGTTITVTLPKN
jgi:signal transduction histidine kinase